jgi:hypothetical protein
MRVRDIAHARESWAQVHQTPVNSCGDLGCDRRGAMAMIVRETTKRRSFRLPVSLIVRVNLLAALAAVVLVAAAAPGQALAQTTTSRLQNNDFSITVTDPCNADTATMNGRETLKIQTTQDTTGPFHLKIQDHQIGNGTSATTGIQYQYQLMNNVFAFDSSTSTFSITVSFKNRIIGNTQNDNFFLSIFNKTVVKAGQTTVTIDRFTTSCT